MRQLTPRQREVLKLLGEGLTHEAIAERLKISRASVKKHIVNICEKAFCDVGRRSPWLKAFVESKLLE